MNAPGRFRIEAAQQPMKGTGFSALACGQAVAQCLISLGTGKQAIDQSAQIKTCTASHHGQTPARGNFIQYATPQARILARREHLVRVKNINQMVGDTPACFERQLGRAGIEIPVNLQGIAIHHLALEAAGHA